MQSRIAKLRFTSIKYDSHKTDDAKKIVYCELP